MKRSPTFLVITNAILCLLLFRCAQADPATMIQSRFKALPLPMEIKLHQLDSVPTKDTLDDGPFSEAVHVLGWHTTSKEVLALYYLSNYKGCMAAHIRTYKGGETVTDQTISSIICPQPDCGNILTGHLAIVVGGQFTSRTEQIYLPCDSTDTPAAAPEARTIRILSGHIDLEGRVLTQTTTTRTPHAENKRIQAQ